MKDIKYFRSLNCAGCQCDLCVDCSSPNCEICYRSEHAIAADDDMYHEADKKECDFD